MNRESHLQPSGYTFKVCSYKPRLPVVLSQLNAAAADGGMHGIPRIIYVQVQTRVGFLMIAISR